MMTTNLSPYRQLLNLQDATFTLIEHEDAIVATVFKVKLPDGTDRILKICLLPRHYERELYFLRHFAGKISVPQLIGHVPPNENISGAILMECFPGNVLKKDELTSSLAFQMGSLLAQIHLNRTPGYGDLANPDTLSSSPHEPFIKKFQTHLAESRDQLSPLFIRSMRKLPSRSSFSFRFS